MSVMNNKMAAAIALALAASAPAWSADRVELSLDTLASNNVVGQTSTAMAKSGGGNAMTALLARDESFALKADRNLGGGERLERGQQTFRGLPVWGAEYTATRDKNGIFTFVSGTVYQNLGRDVTSVTPRLDGKAVSLRAKQAFFGLKPQVGGRNALKQAQVLPAVEHEKAPELMIFQGDDGRASLAYRVTFFSKGKKGQLPKQPVMFIDANTGKVLFQYDNLQTEEAGSGPGGNARMGQIEHSTSGTGLAGATMVTKSGSTCSMSNTATRVMNANNGTSTSSTTPVSFSCTTTANRFVEATVNGGYGVLNDILFNGAKTVEMYKTWFNVAPHPHCSGTLRQYGHYDSGLDNAFWSNCTMAYGDGSSFHPLVSMDVVGHEISHGVTEARSNLAYSGQSGGLNESFSDIAGMAAIYYVGGNVDWKIGSMIKKTSGQMRCMDDPTCDGRSIKNVANYTSGMDVHYSSGVYNHAFYRLATTAGWNVKKAFEVYYRANNNYWTSSSTFQQAGDGVCKAAIDLGYSATDVKASLTAVGVTGTACGGGGGGTTTTLSNGVALGSQGAAAGSGLNYKIDVPAGASNLKFVTTGGSGDADLYVKFGSAPTSSSNDCKSEGSTSAESCTIAAPSTGTYYALLSAYSTFSGVTITASYSTGGGGGGSSEVEPNDSTAAANSVSTSGTTMSGNMGSSTDSDYFKVTLPAGATLTATLTPNTSSDYDLYIYNSSGTQVAASENGSGAVDTASNTNSTTAASVRYVRVKYYSGGTGATNGKYTVKLTW
ncbi:peptidase [Permianibacter sp. IMCC34836]|uniref:M4 family metallopeptidase n=1 Tax=Permianibacter fluminis TaxID=2738515 RepID=UPI0015568923|nr:M4 family metallopeptidase [Permianibacter fluminis]NQD35568.1 peptidase [Permianibacter fluminis]